MTKIFVTGADGLLGSNLVRELLRREYVVTVLSQKGRHVSTLDGLAIEKVEGDLLDKESLRKGMSGCELVIHAAASTSIWPSRNKIVNRVNIQGTQNIMDLALESGIKRLVYVGTANTFGFGSKEEPGKEGDPYKGNKYGMDYMDSKYKAHFVVLDTVKRGLNAVIVNPTFMLGPYDSAPSSGAMILAVYHKKVPGFAPGGRNYICVKDAAIGVANALTMGRTGESYIIGNRNMSYKEAFTLMAEVLKVDPPKRMIPGIFIRIFGLYGSFVGTVFKKKPTVSYPMASVSCDEHYFTAAKAVEELKLPQSPIEEGIQEAFQWFKENNYV